MLTLRNYHQESRRPEVAVLLAAPLFAAYELGLLFLTRGDVRNAADVLLKRWLGLMGRTGSLLVTLLVLAAFLTSALRFGRRAPPRGVLPLLVLEGAAYGILLGPVIALLERLTKLSASAAGSGINSELVLGIGAGLYEELLFRLILVGGGAFFLIRFFHVDPIWARSSALIVSSALFSAFHHMGSLGEPWEARVFVYRFLAGVVLGALFVFRGFGIACWTHAAYDIFVTLSTAR